MAPEAANKGDASSGKNPIASESTVEKTSTKISQPGSRKRNLKASSRAPRKKRKSAVGKKAAAPRGMSKKTQRQVSKDYQRLMKLRRLFGEDVDASDGSSTDPEDRDLQTLIDNTPDVEANTAKKEQGMIDSARKRFSELIDPVSSTKDGYVLRGIKSVLTPLQFATLGWMIWRETSSTSPKGGIVAHGMGVGKTLMALSALATNKTGLERKKANDCSTLVVVPSSAVIDHWRQECTRHAPSVFPPKSTGLYRNMKRAETVESFKPFKIVFATYGEIAREIPDGYKEPASPDKEFDCGAENVTEEYAWAPIFEATWYRVILDEAHAIKNKTSKASLAIRRLRKRYGWAISATLATNGREEMYPYFNFLGVNGSEYPNSFLEKYFPEKAPTLEFQKIMTRVVISRKIGEKFLDEKVLALPEHHTSTEKLTPTAKERVILSFIRAKIRAKVDKSIEKSKRASEEGTAALSKALSSVTGLLHVYRFAGIHPFLIENTFMREFSMKECEKLTQDLEAAEADTGEISEESGSNLLSIDKIFRLGLKHRQVGRVKCWGCMARCADIEKGVYKLPCGHFACLTCLAEAAEGQEAVIACGAKGCSQSHSLLTREFHPTLYQPEEPRRREPPQIGADCDGSSSESEDNRGKGKGRRKKTKKKKPKSGPGTDFLGKEPQLDSHKGRFLACLDKLSNKSTMVVPSAKILRVQELLRTWKQSAPDDKIIIFTQFMVVACIVGRIARLEGIDFIYYTGDLSETARARALDTFRENDRPKILVTSLMCGGQALNITCANRVILMELWWNSPAEEQAFGRVYRMGQEKAVHVVRLKCKGTREDQMDKMQAMKMKDIQKCMLSKKMTKSNTTKHTIFTLLGFPVMENGVIDRLERPRGAYLSDTMDESDGEDQYDEGEEKLQHVEELQGEEKTGNKVDEKGGDEEQEGVKEKETDQNEDKADVQNATKEAMEEDTEAKEDMTDEKEGQKVRKEVLGGGAEAEEGTNLEKESDENANDDTKVEKHGENEAKGELSAGKGAGEGFAVEKEETDEVKLQKEVAEAMDVDVETIPDEKEGMEATDGIEGETSVANDRSKTAGDETRKDGNKAEGEKSPEEKNAVEVDMDLD